MALELAKLASTTNASGASFELAKEPVDACQGSAVAWRIDRNARRYAASAEVRLHDERADRVGNANRGLQGAGVGQRSTVRLRARRAGLLARPDRPDFSPEVLAQAQASGRLVICSQECSWSWGQADEHVGTHCYSQLGSPLGRNLQSGNVATARQA